MSFTVVPMAVAREGRPTLDHNSWGGTQSRIDLVFSPRGEVLHPGCASELTASFSRPQTQR